MLLLGKSISQEYGERELSTVPSKRVEKEQVAPWACIGLGNLGELYCRWLLSLLFTGPFLCHMDRRLFTGLQLAAALR